MLLSYISDGWIQMRPMNQATLSQPLRSNSGEASLSAYCTIHRFPNRSELIYRAMTRFELRAIPPAPERVDDEVERVS